MAASQSVSDALAKAFSVNIKTKLFLRKGFDEFRIKELWNYVKRKHLIEAQAIKLDMHGKCGSDVAVARFVLDYCINGRVMLLNQPNKWIDKLNAIPPRADPAIKLVKIDCSNSFILNEGIDNFVGLEHLKSLDLSGNTMLNDFACDQLARQFRASKSLEEINLSNVPSIGISGVETLMRIPSLKKIIVKNTWAARYENFKLFSMLAEDEKGCGVER